jgi:hypothetical protein
METIVGIRKLSPQFRLIGSGSLTRHTMLSTFDKYLTDLTPGTPPVDVSMTGLSEDLRIDELGDIIQDRLYPSFRGVA